jgi:hypothetical protein
VADFAGPERHHRVRALFEHGRLRNHAIEARSVGLVSAVSDAVCVSSFSALVKGKEFILIFSPNIGEIALAVALCIALCLVVFGLKYLERR